MRARAIYVFTHDSIGLGEDGPTHQPIEHLSLARSYRTGGLASLRAVESAVAGRAAIERTADRAAWCSRARTWRTIPARSKDRGASVMAATFFWKR